MMQSSNRLATIAVGVFFAIAVTFLLGFLCAWIMTSPRFSYWNGIAQVGIIGGFAFVWIALLGEIAALTKDWLDLDA